MVNRIIDPEQVNFLPFGLFLEAALQYAEELFPFYFKPEELTGTSAPMVREAWESIPSIRQMLGPRGRSAGSWERAAYPENHPAAAEQILNLYYMLRKVFETDSSRCFSFFRNPIPEGEKVRGLEDWRIAEERFSQWHTERDHRAFTPSSGPWGVSDRGLTDFVLHCLLDFPCFNNWPSERSLRRHIPVEIRIRTTEHGVTTETLLDRNSAEQIPAFQVWDDDIYLEFQVTVNPWFTGPYTWGILLYNRVFPPDQPGGPNTVNLGGKEYGDGDFMLYAESTSAPVTGEQHSPLFRMPHGAGMRYWWSNLRIYVQPVLTDWLQEHLSQDP